MTLLRRLLQNTILLFLSNLFTKATTALLFIFIARKLGPTEGGLFTLGITYSLMIMLPLVGMEDFLIRELVRNRNTTRKYLINFVTMRLSVTIILYLLLIVFLSFSSTYPPRTIQVIFVMAFSALSEGLFTTGQSVFFSHEKFRYPVTISFLIMMFKTLGGIMVLLRGGGLEVLMFIYIGGSWLGAILSIWGAIKLASTVEGSWGLDAQFCRQALISAVPFILMGMLIGLELQADVIILSLLTNETVVGLYSAATTVFATLALLPTAYRMAVFPLMTRLALESKEALFCFYEKSIYYTLFFSLPLVAGIGIIAPTLLELIYKDKFGPSIIMAQILIWALIFLFVNVSNTRLLLVLDLQRWIPLSLSLSLVFNISANLLLIPNLEGIGAAIARIVSTSSYTLITFIIIHRHLLGTIEFQNLRLVPRIILSTIVMEIVASSMLKFSLVIVIITGVGVYLSVAFLIGTIPLDDRRFLQKFVPQILN